MIKNNNEEFKEKSKETTINNLPDMVNSVCGSEYDTIYTSSQLKKEGVFQCNDSYYVKVFDEKLRGRKEGEIYEIGYTYHEEVEKLFPEGIYFYRKSAIVGIANKLKIIVKTKDEEELINRYAPRFYQFIKKINEEYGTDLFLDIYYNESLLGIESTYDSLFLMAILLIF